MNKTLNFYNNICLRASDNHKGAVHSLSNVVFHFPEATHLQGVQHSSSLPDCIEDKKSGGQQTDCLAKNLCANSTIIIGREARNRQMLKTVNKSTLIGTL